MAKQNSRRVGLSKSILEMKFMKRTKDKLDKESYQKEGEEYFANHHLTKNVGQFIIEPSYVFCENLIDGRLSFQGENPEIEKLMELEEKQKNGANVSQTEEDTDISNEQMANVWKSTKKINVRNIEKRDQRRDVDFSVEPQRKKPKFLKPKDYKY